LRTRQRIDANDPTSAAEGVLIGNKDLAGRIEDEGEWELEVATRGNDGLRAGDGIDADHFAGPTEE